MTPAIAFFLIVWVYALPGGIESQWTFADRFTNEAVCLQTANPMRRVEPVHLQALEPRATETIYSRFICVPVPEVDPFAG
jgi:hypothetical protein